MGWHRRVLDWSLARPLWLGVICVLLVGGYLCGLSLRWARTCCRRWMKARLFSIT